MAETSLKAGLLFGLALLLAACASNKDAEEKTASNEPAELEAIESEVRPERIWRLKFGAVGDAHRHHRLRAEFVDGRIYLANVAGEVFAVDAASGRRLWSARPAAHLSGGVGVGGGLALVGDRRGNVLALDADDGSLRWSVNLGAQILSAPTADERGAVARSDDGRVWGLALDDGAVRWRHSRSPPLLTLNQVGAPVLAAQGRLALAGFADGWLVAVDRDKGEPLWRLRVATPKGKSAIERLVDVDARALLHSGRVFAVGYQGDLVAARASDGAVLWREAVSSFRDLAEGLGHIYVVDEDDRVVAFDRSDGARRWQQDGLRHRRLSAPTVVGGYVVVCDAEGYCHMLSEADGHLAGRLKSGERAQPRAVGETLFVQTLAGELSAWRLQSL